MLSEKELDEFEKEFEEDFEEEVEVVEEETPADDDKADQDLDQTDNKTDDLADDKPEDEEPGEANVWDGLTDKQRQEVQLLQSNLAKAEHAAKSDRGRHKALQAKIAKLEEEKADLLANGEQPEEELDDELESLKEELPEVNSLVEKSNKKLKDQIEKLNKKLDGVVTPTQVDEPSEDEVDQEVEIAEQSQEFANQQTLIVQQKHPDFMEICADPNYATWLGKQSAGVQALANSHDANDAIALFDMFKSVRKVATKKELNDELDTMVEAPNKGSSKSTLVSEDDFDAHFERFSKELEEQNKI